MTSGHNVSDIGIMELGHYGTSEYVYVCRVCVLRLLRRIRRWEEDGEREDGRVVEWMVSLMMPP